MALQSYAAAIELHFVTDFSVVNNNRLQCTKYLQINFVICILIGQL